MTAYKWDPRDYEKSSSAQKQWAQELIRKLRLKGDERLLDIGCGDGKITAEIASHLPSGSVLGADSSEEMLAFAEDRYPPESHPNLRFQLADASRLPFRDEFDIVFSNAALHWVREHLPVLRGIARGLKRGGRAMLQMGGKGNGEHVRAAFENLMDSEEWRGYFQGFTFPYGFYGPEEYLPWMIEAGLHARRVELFPRDMVHDSRAALEGWVRTTWLPYTQRVPQDRQAAFIARVLDTYLTAHPPDAHGRTHVAMVRLEIEAARP